MKIKDINRECNLKFRRYTYFLKVGGGTANINPYSRATGCYIVKHLKTKKIYIGSSRNIAGRMRGHRKATITGNHKNKNLQKLIRQSPNLSFFVHRTSSIEEAQRLEQFLVDKYYEKGIVLNVAIENVLISALGRKLTKKHKAALLKASLGVKRSKEARQRMRESHLGIPLTEDHKRKLSEVHKKRLSTKKGKAAHARGIEKLSHAVMCAGVRYNSKSEAARQLNVHVTTIMHRIKATTYPDYYMLSKGKRK